jgi:hypothetical protein
MNANMTIQEVIAAKHVLEKAMADAIEEFERSTQCTVEDIDLDRAFFHGAPTKYLVTTEVGL